MSTLNPSKLWQVYESITNIMQTGNILQELKKLQANCLAVYNSQTTTESVKELFKVIPVEQTGIRLGRSCVDQDMSLTTIVNNV